MNEEIPLWAAMFIGAGVGILFIGLLLPLIRWSKNAKTKKDAKGEGEEDQINFDLPSGEYDSTGRLFPTELQEVVEADESKNPSIQIPENLQKRIEAKEKQRGKRTSYEICN